MAIDIDLAHHHERLAVIRGDERMTEVRFMVRSLLARIDGRDITYGDAADVLRAILAGLEGCR